jgi:hypothetical protein
LFRTLATTSTATTTPGRTSERAALTSDDLPDDLSDLSIDRDMPSLGRYQRAAPRQGRTTPVKGAAWAW